MQAPEGLALALVGTEGTEVPEEWKTWTPAACCKVCETVQKTRVCTKADFEANDSLPAFVMAAGWYYYCPT